MVDDAEKLKSLLLPQYRKDENALQYAAPELQVDEEVLAAANRS